MRRFGSLIIALAVAGPPALAHAGKTRCNDGAWVPGRGEACRHHGGPAHPVVRTDRPPTEQHPARARCRDGTVQFSTAATCRHRGGVKYWM